MKVDTTRHVTNRYVPCVYTIDRRDNLQSKLLFLLPKLLKSVIKKKIYSKDRTVKKTNRAKYRFLRRDSVSNDSTINKDKK